MRDRDRDLIAALAEGRLEDETEARALLASSPEAQAEYEAQKAALEALTSAESVSLTESERAMLHRDVWTELRSPTSSASASSIPWYYRWASVAAGLFIVVGVFAVIIQGGSTDEGGEATPANLAATETTSEAADMTTMADSAEAADDAIEEGQVASDGATADEDLSRALAPSDIAFYSAVAETIRSTDAAEPQPQTFDTAPTEAEVLACIEDAGLDDYEVHGAFPAPSETDDEAAAMPEEPVPYIVAIGEGADIGSAPIAFVDLTACEVIHIDG